MSPEYVRPYVKAQKNDDRDAEVIAEARDPADNALCRTGRARTSLTCRRFIDPETGWSGSGQL